ncbi:MAG: hypothetical protein HOI95_29710 [Chromatiales bacterium]|nr:hypothetical protein [Chromatiales bacterium]
MNLANTRRAKGLLVVNANIFVRTLAVQVTFFYFASVGSRQGDDVVAANAVLIHLFHFMSYGLDGFAFAVEALAGRALGARDAQALKAMVRSAAMWSAVTALAFSLLYLVLGHWLIMAITTVPSVVDIATAHLWWLVAAPLVSVWCYLFDGVFFGTTHTKEARNSILLAALAYFSLLPFLLPAFGNHGLWLGVLIFMAIRGVCLFAWYPRVLLACT